MPQSPTSFTNEETSLGSKRTTQKGRILAVDDEPITLKTIELLLLQFGYEVIATDNPVTAQHLIENKGPGFFDCLVTDFSMPQLSGIELMGWVRNFDPGVATVIVTAQEDRDLVKNSFREGAVDFLDKPLKPATFSQTVEAAIDASHARRRLQEFIMGLREAGGAAQFLREDRCPDIEPFLETAFLPRHEIGGDFLQVFHTAGNAAAIFIGDVSGHDVRSAFLSAYFQGLKHGLTRGNTSVADILAYFHRRILACRGDPFSGNGSLSFSLSAVCLLLKPGEPPAIDVLNCGSPATFLAGKDGRILKLEPHGSPLGWFDDESFEPVSIPAEGLAYAIASTDGLSDHAAKLEISPLCLLHNLLSDPAGQSAGRVAASTDDDILGIRFRIDRSERKANAPIPLLAESYNGHETPRIDTFHDFWLRSLRTALPQIQPDRLDEIALCARELLLNALDHGCARSAEKQARLHLSWRPADHSIRLIVEDPGEGHSFDIAARDAALANIEPNHLGLLLVEKMATSLTFERHGATAIAQFHPTNRPD